MVDSVVDQVLLAVAVLAAVVVVVVLTSEVELTQAAQEQPMKVMQVALTQVWLLLVVAVALVRLVQML